MYIKVNMYKLMKIIAIILILVVIVMFVFVKFTQRNLDNLDVSDFKFLKKGISDLHISIRVGIADEALGAYGTKLIYVLNDKSKIVLLETPLTYKLISATLVHTDGTEEILVK